MDVQELMSRLGSHLSVSRAFGTAYEKDGSMIIPVAFVAGGGGGGEGPITAASDEDAQSEDSSATSSGAGGGFGGVVMPVGAYVVKDDQVRWVPAVSANLVVLAGVMVLRLLLRARRRSRRAV